MCEQLSKSKKKYKSNPYAHKYHKIGLDTM